MKLADLPTNQLAGAIIVAVIAAILKWIYDLRLAERKENYDRRLAERKDQLDRLNRQLELLYGPLLALSHASNQAWAGFRSIYRPEGRFFDPDKPMSQAELEAWKLWMTEVFMPLNQRIEDVLLDRLDLLEETEVPRCLLELFSHVEGYKGVIKQWESNNYDRYLSTNNYPQGIEKYARDRYIDLKTKQSQLLHAHA